MKNNLFIRMINLLIVLVLFTSTSFMFKSSPVQASQLNVNKTALDAATISKLLDAKKLNTKQQTAKISSTIKTTSPNPVNVIIQMESEPVAKSNYSSEAGRRSSKRISTEATIKKE
ncbi:MAG: hypothetical protein RR651_14080, partial [Lysinibacillus sp.]